MPVAGNMIGNVNAANLPSTSANQMMNQPGVGAMSQQNAQQPTMGMGPNAQRQPNQNASMMMNQNMAAGNLSTLQQMKQNQQQIAGNNMFGGAGGGGGVPSGGVNVGVGAGAGGGAAGMIQQRQVCSLLDVFCTLVNFVTRISRMKIQITIKV